MKKIAFFLVFISITVSLYAQSASTRNLFIEGTAENETHYEFFMTNFTLEARTAGFIITRKKEDAAFTFRFNVTTLYEEEEEERQNYIDPNDIERLTILHIATKQPAVQKQKKQNPFEQETEQEFEHEYMQDTDTQFIILQEPVGLYVIVHEIANQRTMEHGIIKQNSIEQEMNKAGAVRRDNVAQLIIQLDIIEPEKTEPETIEPAVIAQLPTGQYALNITLINNRNDRENVSFDFFYSELIEMFAYTQFLFHRATIHIPNLLASERIDTDWQNKWLYFRISMDYPMVFYQLNPTGLYLGQAVYEGSFEDPNHYIPLEHIVTPQPGVTLGLEFQFLKNMSIEGNIQASFGDTSTYVFLNWAAGCELKFPMRTKYLMYQPFITYIHALNTSTEIFSEFPVSSVGGGIQIAVRGGRDGAFFVNISYLQLLGDIYKINPYMVTPITPNPETIHYNRFVFNLGFGYKHGSFNKKYQNF